MLGHPLCTNFAITKLFVDYVMHSSFAYRHFNSNFTCGDPTILPYEFIHSRNRGTVGHNMRLTRAWQLSAMGLEELWLQIGTGKNKLFIAIHSLDNSLSKEKCDALPFFPSLTGCDTTSVFQNRKADSVVNMEYL
ncbi:hypothetical protein AVEN_165225-1 [Araneus ventricosus]|uniref:Uncharacterized protein n=1 Tax=Araneus ventricosus TaxID=182803 RepID=A0A4Y2B771_ARAVE|nr:hypothetical protein AVEN_165225-1 [Araneus ventricosus]